MSMISAQCDELRQMADGQATFHDAREVMLEAADTIWELRCRLVDAEDRVRKSVELCKLCEREAENAKLRELCKRVLKNCYDAYEQVWGWDDDWVILCDEARELGVEVDR